MKQALLTGFSVIFSLAIGFLFVNFGRILSFLESIKDTNDSVRTTFLIGVECGAGLVVLVLLDAICLYSALLRLRANSRVKP